MKDTTEMNSGAMIYIPSFIMTGSGIQKFIWEDTQTQRKHGDVIKAYFYFFKIRKVGYKTHHFYHFSENNTNIQKYI